ncbi:hypothetical protein BH23CHL5_BH23CHL5_23800 [soil metagenome]
MPTAEGGKNWPHHRPGSLIRPLPDRAHGRPVAIVHCKRRLELRQPVPPIAIMLECCVEIGQPECRDMRVSRIRLSARQPDRIIVESPCLQQLETLQVAGDTGTIQPPDRPPCSRSDRDPKAPGLANRVRRSALPRVTASAARHLARVDSEPKSNGRLVSQPPALDSWF